ncbi:MULTISPECIES: patatin-like phospholipase family protein [Maribacter]|uniref:Patatin-like phospholipase family protein n=2 Tax=Maribacter flavus TaxID=1658664 RepID=A0ABU7IF37_9FLAO|nr:MULTISPECIES: patatin-like phospholipase family protein [Maribacter]MDC6404428.1 patatin-like phospholipase family protein [Maribacter sp. PR66]MEE1971572.1 patatin-like phospholipase family protein [Maribacter flavus]
MGRFIDLEISQSWMLRIILLSLLFQVSLQSYSQQDNHKRPKVGLVLSGGGAKGMAHIGALKVIEEAGVEIDYVGGTSMGPIVGALYAAGYTADQLDSIFRATDFINLIQDNLPRNAKTFYEKEDSERYALTLPFDNFKITVPTAFSGGQNIYNELVRLLYHVKDVNDFYKLPIPFVCIATDIETGEEVVLDSGYLPQAIMASGTLPSLFEPSSIDNRILIDGGVVNNYPIDKVRNMGADIIIGIDVQHDLSKRDALMSATEILSQINNYRTVRDMVQKSKKTDIYIRPDIAAFSVIQFDKAAEIIEKGMIAAREKLNALSEIGSNSKIDKDLIKYKTLRDSITINRLIINGNNQHTRGYVKGKLRFNLAEPITFKKLQQGISNLTATGNFTTNRYKLVSNGTGEDLILRLDETPNTSFIRLGAHYDDLYKSAAIINFTKKNLVLQDDVASFDLILGDNVRYNFQYYVDKGTYWSFGLNSRFSAFSQDINFDLIRQNFEVPFGTNLNNLNLDVSDFTNQLYIQTVLREEFAFTLGAEYKYLKYSTRTIEPFSGVEENLVGSASDDRLYFENGSFFSVFGNLKLDTYDDRYFPTKGLYFDGDMHYYILSSDFNQNFKDFSISKARMGAAFPIFKNLSMNIETEGGFKLGTSGVTTFDFVLGGFGTDLINNFVPFYGYDFLSLPGNSFVKAYGRLDYEFYAKNHLLFSANYANVEDDLFRTGEWFSSPDFSGYGIGYGWESFIGPIQVLYSWSPEGKNSNFFFSIGYWF